MRTFYVKPRTLKSKFWPVAGPDEGWGTDPREWSGTLQRLVRERMDACQIDTASFGRKQRPVSQNMSIRTTGLSRYDEAT